MIQLKFIIGILVVVLMVLVGADTYYDTSCKKINELSYEGDATQLTYFPDSAFGSEQQSAESWYSEELASLREPSLWAVSEVCEAAVYRFVVLSRSESPISVRLIVRQDGGSTLHVKQFGQNGIAIDGLGNEGQSLRLSESETDEITRKIRNADFWEQSGGELDFESKDSAWWIIEGAKGGHYNLVSVENPQDGPFYEAGLAFLNAIQATIELEN